MEIEADSRPIYQPTVEDIGMGSPFWSAGRLYMKVSSAMQEQTGGWNSVRLSDGLLCNLQLNAPVARARVKIVENQYANIRA